MVLLVDEPDDWELPISLSNDSFAMSLAFFLAKEMVSAPRKGASKSR